MSDLQVRGPLFGGTGTPSPFTADFSGAQRVTDGHARYTDAVLRGNVFSAATTTGVVLAAAGTNSPILTIWNPANSQKYVSIIDVSIGLTALLFTTVGITAVLGGLANTTAPTTVTNAGTIGCNLIGSANLPIAKTYSQATLGGTPTAIRHIATFADAVLTTSGGAVMAPAMLKDEIAGVVTIAPGSLVNIFGVGTVANTTVVAAITWEEIQILL